jgi:hypothetical protein
MKEWLIDFKKAHEKYRQGDLSGADRRTYLDAREQLADALLKAQGLQRNPNEPARKAFRVAQAQPVEIRIGEEKVQALTLDVARGGFSALIAAKLDMEQVIQFTLKMPSSDPLSGKAKVMSVRRQGVANRYSFLFTNVSENDQDRVETLLFDWALARMNF